MTAEKTPAGGPGSRNSAAGSVRFFYSTDPENISPESDPSEYEHNLRVWSRGFNAAWSFLSPQLAQAEADRDRYYYELYNSAEVKQRHREALKAFGVLLHRRGTDAWWAELERSGLSAVEAPRD